MRSFVHASLVALSLAAAAGVPGVSLTAIDEIDSGNTSGTTGGTTLGTTGGGTTGGTTGSVGSWTFNPPQGLADEFACLKGRSNITKVVGTHTSRYMPRPANGQAFDARTGTFIVQSDVRQSAVNLESYEKDICWAGGYITSTFRNFDPYILMKKMDHAGLRFITTDTKINGVHVFFTEDGIRPARRQIVHDDYFTIAHVWVDHIRADCIENDSLGSGLVYDSLFNGCSTGISMRAGGGENPDETHHTVTFDHVLMYMEPMPNANCTRPEDGCGRTEGVNKVTIDGVGYGFSNLFKVRSGSPRVVVKDSVFVIPMQGRNKATSVDIPANVKECSNNIIVWTGNGEYPGKYPKHCFTVTRDINVWKNAVEDWHARHPNVGANRKPPAYLMGNVDIPRPMELRPAR